MKKLTIWIFLLLLMALSANIYFYYDTTYTPSAAPSGEAKPRRLIFKSF